MQKKSNITIHVPVNDMEIAEDTQMIIFNIIKQWLIRTDHEYEASLICKISLSFYLKYFSNYLDKFFLKIEKKKYKQLLKW